MMSATGEAVRWKKDVLREVAFILLCKPLARCRREEVDRKQEQDIINGSP